MNHGRFDILKTQDLENMVNFYTQTIECVKWVSQQHIEIVKHDYFLIGFHASNSMDLGVLFSFFYPSKSEVDFMFDLMKSMGLASTEPGENPKYRIYNFFAKDLEGRKLEFQTFLHQLPPI